MRVEIEQIGQERGMLALERFEEGEGISVGPLSILPKSDNRIAVNLNVHWDSQFISEEKRRALAMDVPIVFRDLLSKWPELNALVSDRIPSYSIWGGNGKDSWCLGRLNENGEFSGS